MKPTILALGLAMAATLAPVALAQDYWFDGESAGADLGYVAASAGSNGVYWDVRPDPSGPSPPPPPPPAPAPAWHPSGHDHEEGAEEDAPAEPEEPAAPHEEEEAAPLLPEIVSTLVPLPFVGSGPVPRLDLSTLTSTVTTLVPRLPEVAPAYGPPARPAPAVETQGEAAGPVDPREADSTAFVVGVAAAAAAASAAPVSSGWWRFRRLGLLGLLYSRIAKERLLDHGSRERLLEAVRTDAGSTVADLATRTGLPRNTVTYHMRILEREHLVASTRQGRHRLYFAPGSLERRGQADLLVAMRHDTTRAIAREIARTPGVDQKALCERTGISPSLAHWHARRLVDAGAVDSRREGRSVRYYPVGDIGAHSA